MAIYMDTEGGSRDTNIVRKNGSNWELIHEEFPAGQYQGYVIETESTGRITNIFWSHDISQ